MLIDTNTLFVPGIFLTPHVVEAHAVKPIYEQDLDDGNDAVNQPHVDVPQ